MTRHGRRLTDRILSRPERLATMKLTTLGVVGWVLPLTAMMAALHPATAAGQDHPRSGVVIHRKSAAEALALFEQEKRSEQPKNIGGAMMIIHLLTHPDRAQATVDSILSGLENLALNADVQRVRTAAATSLVFTGDTRRPDHLPGAFARSMRVYRQSRDPLVRATMLPILPFYAEQGQVVAFLKSVATQSPSEQDYPDASSQAISALTYMGQEGRAALRELHESKGVRDPAAEALLRYVMRQKPHDPKP